LDAGFDDGDAFGNESCVEAMALLAVSDRACRELLEGFDARGCVDGLQREVIG